MPDERFVGTLAFVLENGYVLGYRAHGGGWRPSRLLPLVDAAARG
jgi:hypothetical protein